MVGLGWDTETGGAEGGSWEVVMLCFCLGASHMDQICENSSSSILLIYALSSIYVIF